MTDGAKTTKSEKETLLNEDALLAARSESSYSVDRRFFELLHDAIALAVMSQEYSSIEDDRVSYNSGILARSSVLNSSLLLECAANCCIYSLDLTGKFSVEIDQLGFLPKFDLYLRLKKPGKTLDRGIVQVEKASEVARTVRNLYVHPKVTRAKWEEIQGGYRRAKFKQTKKLEISEVIAHWRFEDAISALKAATDFIDHFFIDICGYDDWTTTGILMSPDEDGSRGVDVWSFNEFSKARNEWGIPLRFLGSQS